MLHSCASTVSCVTSSSMPAQSPEAPLTLLSAMCRWSRITLSQPKDLAIKRTRDFNFSMSLPQPLWSRRTNLSPSEAFSQYFRSSSSLTVGSLCSGLPAWKLIQPSMDLATLSSSIRHPTRPSVVFMLCMIISRMVCDLPTPVSAAQMLSSPLRCPMR